MSGEITRRFGEAWLDMVVRTIWALYQEELEREPDPDGLASCLWSVFHGETADTMRESIRASAEWTEKHRPVPPVPAIRARRGPTRFDGRVLLDDDGPFLGLGCSCFWAPWGFKHDRDRLAQNFEWLSSFRIDDVPVVNYLRIFCEIRGGPWSDREIDPRWPDYDDVILGTVDLAYDYGFRSELTIFGGVEQWSASEQDALVDRLAQLLRGREHKLAHWELANEGGGTGMGDVARARALTRRLKAQTGVPVAISSYHEDAALMCAMYDGWIADIGTYHFDRAAPSPEGPWRSVRQPWNYPDEIKKAAGPAWADTNLPPGSSNEPKGQYSSVSEDRDPARLALHAIVSWISGLPFTVLHPGAGIYGGGQGAQRDAAPANFWECQGLEETLRCLCSVIPKLPADLPGWERQNAQWGGAPFTVSGFWAAGDDHGVVRFYSAVRGERFVSAAIGVRHQVELTARWRTTFEIIDLPSGEVVNTAPLDRGQRIVLPGGPPSAERSWILRSR